jgi:hypothetical protein
MYPPLELSTRYLTPIPTPPLFRYGKGDYARLGATGAWMFNGQADGTFVKGFQTYDGLDFGLPSSFQVVTGKFSAGRTSYARLGGTQAFVFLHK